MFKEVRILDNAEGKHDMDTFIKPKRLPITRKFYAFYHAPIVKFWFNTVSRFLFFFNLRKNVFYVCTFSSLFNNNLCFIVGLPRIFDALYVCGSCENGRITYSSRMDCDCIHFHVSY